MRRANQALHIDRKGRGVVGVYQSWCFRCLLQTLVSLAASELGRYADEISEGFGKITSGVKA